MIWKNFSPLAIASRRRVVASAVIYGLSLAVRFTSAAGEEIEVPAQVTQRANPMLSIMMNDGGQPSYKDWFRKSVQPVAFHRGWPPSSPAPGCMAP